MLEECRAGNGRRQQVPVEERSTGDKQFVTIIMKEIMQAALGSKSKNFARDGGNNSVSLERATLCIA